MFDVIFQTVAAFVFQSLGNNQFNHINCDRQTGSIGIVTGILGGRDRQTGGIGKADWGQTVLGGLDRLPFAASMDVYGVSFYFFPSTAVSALPGLPIQGNCFLLHPWTGELGGPMERLCACIFPLDYLFNDHV